MCYVVFLSTTSPEDLSVRDTELMRFERELGNEPAIALLENPHRWYVGSQGPKGCCSCHFRHLVSPELGFGVPEDWYPENSEDIEATGEFFAVIRKLIDDHETVDRVDAWTQTMATDICRREVSVSNLQRGEFRFFENHHFIFK
jgi:hypothetical protein